MWAIMYMAGRLAGPMTVAKIRAQIVEENPDSLTISALHKA